MRLSGHPYHFYRNQLEYKRCEQLNVVVYEWNDL